MAILVADFDHLQGGSQGFFGLGAHGRPAASPTNFQITKLICSQIPVDLCTNLRQFSFFFDKLF